MNRGVIMVQYTTARIIQLFRRPFQGSIALVAHRLIEYNEANSSERFSESRRHISKVSCSVFSVERGS
jgi:hypothetical protein